MLAKAATPQVEYSADGDNWTIVTTGLRDTTAKFKLGVEQDDETTDGRKVKTIYTLESPSKMVQKEKWDGKEATLIREVTGDELKVVIKDFVILFFIIIGHVILFSLFLDHHSGWSCLHPQLQTRLNFVCLPKFEF
jgi:hypothetical protein